MLRETRRLRHVERLVVRNVTAPPPLHTTTSDKQQQQQHIHPPPPQTPPAGLLHAAAPAEQQQHQQQCTNTTEREQQQEPNAQHQQQQQQQHSQQQQQQHMPMHWRQAWDIHNLPQTQHTDTHTSPHADKQLHLYQQQQQQQQQQLPQLQKCPPLYLFFTISAAAASSTSPDNTHHHHHHNNDMHSPSSPQMPIYTQTKATAVVTAVTAAATEGANAHITGGSKDNNSNHMNTRRSTTQEDKPPHSSSQNYRPQQEHERLLDHALPAPTSNANATAAAAAAATSTTTSPKLHLWYRSETVTFAPNATWDELPVPDQADFALFPLESVFVLKVFITDVQNRTSAWAGTAPATRAMAMLQQQQQRTHTNTGQCYLLFDAVMDLADLENTKAHSLRTIPRAPGVPNAVYVRLAQSYYVTRKVACRIAMPEKKIDQADRRTGKDTNSRHGAATIRTPARSAAETPAESPSTSTHLHTMRKSTPKPGQYASPQSSPQSPMLLPSALSPPPIQTATLTGTAVATPTRPVKSSTATRIDTRTGAILADQRSSMQRVPVAAADVQQQQQQQNHAQRDSTDSMVAAAAATEAAAAAAAVVMAATAHEPAPADAERLTVNDILLQVARVADLRRTLEDSQSELRKLTAQLDNNLLITSVQSEVERRVSSLARREVEVSRVISDEQAACARECNELAHVWRGFAPRASALAGQVHRILSLQDSMKDVQRACAKTRTSLTIMQAKCSLRVRKLITQLAQIYPIAYTMSVEQMLANSTVSSSKSNRRQRAALFAGGRVWTIRGVPLPDTFTAFKMIEGENIATALGYVVHVLCMIAKYLETPLRYRLIFRSSRSVICDDVQAFSEFPLFMKGAEERRFECGCVLLNSNIEHLMRLHVPRAVEREQFDFYATLKNLQALIQGLCYAELQ